MNKSKTNRPHFMIYTSLLPSIRTIANECGWAIAVHGSGERDFDLIAFPWRICPVDPETVLKIMASKLGLLKTSEDPEERPHNRKCYVLHCGSDLYLDFSFFVPDKKE